VTPPQPRATNRVRGGKVEVGDTPKEAHRAYEEERRTLEGPYQGTKFYEI
jgi:hypothetical protein